MESFFKLQERNTTVRKEIIAGITTFLSMAYILIVNPATLSLTGMDAGAVFTATALSAIIGTLIMGLYANFPVVQAPGMGMNAFFTYTVCLTMGYSWEQALFGIFISGLIFISLSLSGLREKIINMIPTSLKYAVSAGIGFFIAFIGMQSIGLIVPNEGTIVGLGDITNPLTLLGIIGVFITFIFMSRKIDAGIFFGMIIITIIGIIMQIMGIDLGITTPESIISTPPSLEPIFGKLFSVDVIGLITNVTFWTIVFSFLFVDFFDTSGTLVAVGTEAGFINENGELENSKKALMSDATATTIGAVLGTSSVTSYLESLAGVSAGGRTGLTAVTAAVCFMIALFFSPLLVVVTPAVTAPALITVGALMGSNLSKIDNSDFANPAAAFMTILFMITTYSVSEGISAGFITYTICKIAQGEAKEVSPIMYGLSVVFVLHYFI